MNKFFILLAFTFLVSCQNENQEHENDELDKAQLKIELDTIFKLDQKYRRMIGDTSARYGWDSPQMDKLWEKQNKLDSANLEKVLGIIEKLDTYPGDSLVGYPTRKSAFYVLQHAPDSIQEKYLPMILKAAKDGQLDEKLGAMYHDRYLLHRGLPQIYGSQIRINKITDSVTGEIKKVLEVYKIKDTSKVDSLRRSMGMIPLEEYLNLNGI